MSESDSASASVRKATFTDPRVGRIAAPTGDGPCLVAHGGAWDIPDAFVEEHRECLVRAIEIGRTALLDGHSALDTVTEVIAEMEDSGAFDAGCGAVLTRKGVVELDAGVMDGGSLDFGAVAAVHRISNPIRAARALLDHGGGMVRLLVGESAERFAVAHGVYPVDPHSLVHPRERLRHASIASSVDEYHTSEAFLPGGARMPRGTVGCVARDRSGGLAAGTSTGGTPYRPSGRVGDSPLPGCGFYADRPAAVSATGWGEAIASSNLAGRAVAAIERGDDPEAAAMAELVRMADRIPSANGVPAAGGLIVLSANGSGAWAFTTPRMARAGWADGNEPWVLV